MQLEDLQTPALLIHLDRVRHNLATMRRLLGDDLGRWRPHVKTCKIAEVLRLYLDIGVRRFKCATTREAEVLLAAARPGDGALDLLFAMAQHGANLDRLHAIAAASPTHRVAVLSEDPTHAAVVRARGLGVFVDLDPGYHRTGIPLDQPERVAAVIAAAGGAMRGLHCYDGHLHDNSPTLRRAAAHALYDRFTALASDLGVRGELVTSGTPTFSDALAYSGFAAFEHTISPGTVVYWDARSQELGIDGFQFAAEVLARVISRPTEDRFTLDAGSKALDAAAGSPVAVLQETWSVDIGTPSEEHLPVRMRSGTAPAVGASVRLVPRHVCPTVNLATEAVLLDAGAIIGVVPVGARGHETLPVAPIASR